MLLNIKWVRLSKYTTWSLKLWVISTWSLKLLIFQNGHWKLQDVEC